MVQADMSDYAQALTGTAIEAAQQAAADAVEAASATPALYALSGDDAAGIVVAPVGGTAPNTGTAGAGAIVFNDDGVVRQGYFRQVSIQLSAPGTGTIVIVNIKKSRIVRSLGDVAADTALKTFNVSGFLRRNERIGYKSLTGGRVRTDAGANGRYIANADWDGSANDPVTILSPGPITYAIGYDLHTVGRNKSTEERLTRRRARGAQGLPDIWDVMECYFDTPGDIVENLATPGDNDIDLTVPANQNIVTTRAGKQTRGGMIQTPSITCLWTCQAYRVDEATPVTFIQSGGSGSGVGITAVGSGAGSNSVPLTDTVYVFAGEGLHPILKQPDGLGCIELQDGGWKIIFRRLDVLRTSIFGLGGRHSMTTSRASIMDHGAFLATTADLTEAQMKQTGYALSRYLAERGAYVLDDDCPERADGGLLMGDSSAGGRGYLWQAEAKFTATTYGGLQIRKLTVTAVDAGSGPLMPFMAVEGPGAPRGCHILSQDSSTEAGGVLGGRGDYTINMPISWTGAAGAGKAFTASPYGVPLTETQVFIGSGVQTVRDFAPFELGFNHALENNPSGLRFAGAMLGVARWRKQFKGSTRRRLIMVQHDQGSAYLCPPGTVAAGTTVTQVPTASQTYHPTVPTNENGLFMYLMRAWYRAKAQARNRGIGFKCDILAMCIGAQHAEYEVAAPSAAAIQGWWKAFYDAFVLYNGAAPKKTMVVLTQQGTGQDPARLQRLRDGEEAFRAAIGGVAYDDNVGVPGTPQYLGAPFGQNGGGDPHMNLYS
ncbi:MAG TPA: hypothetical protein VEZ59_09090, partial [Sphingopyxis sp.]|nr:hypothetical protein [Sphingopyxis sp.]